MGAISDKFSNCLDGRYRKTVIIDGRAVDVQRTWQEYTPEEKAACISYKNGCGVAVAMALLELDAEVAWLKTQVRLMRDTTL